MVHNMLAHTPLGKPKVLLLGISYPSVEKQMEKHGFTDDILINKDASVKRAVECARRGILTEMDARDLARCVATEQVCEVDCYSTSREIGAVYRDDRHVYGDFNNRNFCKTLKKAFGDDIQFSQVILDYYWMPSGWLVTRWAKTLFQQTLPDLVKMNMLTYPSSRGRNRAKFEEGVVYLPFCAHVCKELVGGIKLLSQYYSISFVNKTELAGHSLWRGTMSIDGDVMQHVLGKRLDQEEVYCTFRPKDIFENMEDSHVSKPAVMKVLEAIEDYDNIRFIRLRPLRQHEGPSVMKSNWEIEKGGFIGLNYELAKEKRKKAELEAKQKKEEAKKEQLRKQKEAERKERAMKRKEQEEKMRKRQERREQKAKERKAQQDAKATLVSDVEEIPFDESKCKMFFPCPAFNTKVYNEPGKGLQVQEFAANPPPIRWNSPPVGTFSTAYQMPSWQNIDLEKSECDESSKSILDTINIESDDEENIDKVKRAKSKPTSTSPASPPLLREQFLAHNPRVARDKDDRPEQIEYDDSWESLLDVNIRGTEKAERHFYNGKNRGMNVRRLEGDQFQRAKDRGYVGSAVQYMYIPQETDEFHMACKLMGMRLKSRGFKEFKSQIYHREETICFKVPPDSLSLSYPTELTRPERTVYESWRIRIARTAYGSSSLQDGLLYLGRLERMDTILNWFKHNLNPLYDPNGYFASTMPKLVELWGNENMLEKAQALELHIHEEAMSILDEHSSKNDEWKSLNESILRWLQNDAYVDADEAEEFHAMKERLSENQFKSDAFLASEMADRILFLRQLFDWKRSAGYVALESSAETLAELRLLPSHSEKAVLRENRKRPRDEHDVDFIEKKVGRRKIGTNMTPKQVNRTCNIKISTTSNGMLKSADDRQKLQRQRGDSMGTQFSPTIPLARVTPDHMSRLMENCRNGNDTAHQRDARKLVGTFDTTTESAENFLKNACPRIGKQRAHSLLRILMYLQNPEDSFAKENPGIYRISRLIPVHTDLYQKAIMVEAIVHGLCEAHGPDWIHKSHQTEAVGLLIYELLREIESLQRIPNDACEFKTLMSAFVH